METVRVEVPDVPRMMLVGLKVAVGPFATIGETVAVSDTVPVKPLTADTVIVEVPDWPTVKLMEVGLAVTVKSVTVTETVAVWVNAPGLVPVTVTVKPATALEQLTVRVEV